MPVAAAFILILACGLVHGFWTDRWGVSDEPGASAARLELLPLSLGDWDGQDLEMERPPSNEVAGHLYRRYVSKRTGKAVSLFLVCGRPGPVCIHTPDACYGGSGYSVSQAAQFAVPLADDRSADFRTAIFQKRSASELTTLRIFWAWNGGEGWTSPANPRLRFAHLPALYKAYVLRDLASADDPLDSDPCREFLQELIPAFDRAVLSRS
jgi:hypothetical protein